LRPAREVTAIPETAMGRIGLRSVLLAFLFFCAALATASVPAAFAQTHGEKGAPPPLPRAEDSALPTRSDFASNKTSAPSGPTPETESRVAANTNASPDVPPPPADGIARAGEGGVTFPTCRRCPPAQYPYSALIRKIQGSVTMDAVISADGLPSNIKVVASMGAGLDEQAVKAVRVWQFEPARDADGKPVAAHQTIVINFHIKNK
jgi:periplasmic protein TonB